MSCRDTKAPGVFETPCQEMPTNSMKTTREELCFVLIKWFCFNKIYSSRNEDAPGAAIASELGIAASASESAGAMRLVLCARIEALRRIPRREPHYLHPIFFLNPPALVAS